MGCKWRNLTRCQPHIREWRGQGSKLGRRNKRPCELPAPSTVRSLYALVFPTRATCVAYLIRLGLSTLIMFGDVQNDEVAHYALFWTVDCWKLDCRLLETGQWTAGNWTVGCWRLDSGLLETGLWAAGNWALGCWKLDSGCWKLDSGLLETGLWAAGNWRVDFWKVDSGRHWRTDWKHRKYDVRDGVTLKPMSL